MIAHVARAGEQKGRVVVRLTGANPSSVALEAAVRVARAFRSEIESLFVEDDRLFDACHFSFTHEVSASGRRKRALTAETLAAEMRSLAHALQRHMVRLAETAEVPLRHRVVRGEPVHAVAAACRECGPWNVVALAEPIGPGSAEVLGRLAEEVADATGILVVGPRSRRVGGPIVAVVEDEVSLAPLLQSAERLRLAPEEVITVLLVGDDADTLGWIEAQARLAVAGRSDVRLVNAPNPHGTAGVAAEAVRRLLPGFVIARFGGLLVPRRGDLGPLASVLEAPLLLLK
jgi:hypothetical protein